MFRGVRSGTSALLRADSQFFLTKLKSFDNKLPFIAIFPKFAAIKPVSIDIVVVFPAPFV